MRVRAGECGGRRKNGKKRSLEVEERGDRPQTAEHSVQDATLERADAPVATMETL